MKRLGILFVVSGPSGAGKGTVLGKVRGEVEGLSMSISATTREPRTGETDGVDYWFCSKNQFQEMINNKEFLEYIEKFDNFYGTPKAPVEKLLKEGSDVILEIETLGAVNVRTLFPEAVLIFITPQSYDELKRRLDKRGSETDEAKALRLKIALSELSSVGDYDYIAINNDVRDCINTIKAIILAERNKRYRYSNLVEELTTRTNKK
ncbi:MAG: guanylate kinase [Christensenellaceae bacterium]|jgi:guanylate kinase|nr:guanylate kinase [Christensenellaceae bacterium]